MADAAIQFLLDNLKELVVYNAQLITNMKDEIEGLIRDLAILKAFIEDSTDTACQDEVVKVLVTNIRTLAFEAEDAIDIFVVEATVHKSRKWIQKMFSFNHTNKLREVAEKVQTTRAKVKEMYDNPVLGFRALKEKGRNPAGRRMTERRLPDVEKDNVVGFDEATTSLVGRLTEKTKDLQVISIIGMGGLGKTTLANKVYTDPRVSHEFSTRAWIYVSQTYNKKDLFLSILKGVTQVTSTMSDMDEDSLEKEVRGLLTWQYLIVVDDVWEEKDWNSIKKAFPNHENGSRILLTSRLESVAVHADPLSEPYKLNFLTHDQSWELLQRKVFGQGNCPLEDLKDVGVKIAKQCNGLPLAVVVVAGMLQAKKRKDWWETVAKSVNAFVSNEKDLIEVLALSYYHLPPHLKACFLYFGVFPKEYSEIHVWILIRLWIAEGFVKKIENVCYEEMAEDHLEDLVARNLVLVEQRSFSGRIKTCRIHDMLRDLCMREAQKENFLLEIKGLGSNSPSYLDPTINRRLSIHSGVSKYISSGLFGPRVRSFLCFAKDKINLSTTHVGHILEEFKLLRVLHILPIRSPQFPSQMEQLVHLTYVAFYGDIKTIPASMSKLWNLQTLIVETSSRTIDIKADILQMLQFRHLHTNGVSQLHGPGSKKRKHCDDACVSESLQTLSTITPESCTEGVLGRTPFIKKLAVRGKLATLLEENGPNGGSLFNNLTKLQQLVTLKLLNDAFPLPAESKLESLPQWDKFPPNLKNLTLVDTFLEWEHMSVLEMLPELEKLKLKDNAFMGVRWSLHDGGFKKLKALQIWKTDLVYWEAEAHHFPRLQHIVLKDCTRLRKLPSSLAKLKTLRTIKLHQTSRNAATSARGMIQEQQQESNGLKIDIFPSDL